MNFIAGILLLTMNEENSFWALHTIMTQYSMKGFFSSSVSLLRNSLKQFDKCLELMLPEIHAYFKDQLIETTMYATPWFHTLFSHDSQLEFVQRLWDVFFNEGISIIFRLAMAIIKEAKDLLLTLEMTEIVEFLKIVPKQIINPELILQAAYKVPKSYLMVKVYTPEELNGKDTKKYLKQQYEEVMGGIYQIEPKKSTERKHKSEQRKVKPAPSPIIKTPRGKNSTDSENTTEKSLIETQPKSTTLTTNGYNNKRSTAPLVKQAHVTSFREHFPNFQTISEKGEKANNS